MAGRPMLDSVIQIHNLFTVPEIVLWHLINLNGALTQQENTESGGVIVSTMSKDPFAFIIETERGLNFSIRAGATKWGRANFSN